MDVKEDEAEKVYVAVGSDLQDGFEALEWALRKWSSHSISIVLLYAYNNIFKDFVRTPFGKLPASAVSDEKLELLQKYEQEKIDNLLSKYITFCGKVKAEVLKVEKYDEPIHKLIIDLISGLRITKLVTGITFMKSLSGRSRNAISGSFYVHRHKPDYCELFLLCGGKLVFLRDENEEGLMEDDQGTMVAKLREKASFKGWLGKMFNETMNNSCITQGRNPCSPSTSANSPDTQNLWENHVQEIEIYFQELLSSNNLDDKVCEENGILSISPTDSSDMPSLADSNLSVEEKMEAMRVKINEVLEAIQMKRKEAKENVERHARAEWAICLSTRQAEEIEARINKEMTSRMDIQKHWDAAKEHVHEVLKDIQESKSRLNSILELQTDLSNKLNLSSSAKTRAESQLEKAVSARAGMLPEIEKLRRQRDIFQRRIEFCREKDGIGMANNNTRLSEWNSGCSREYTAEEIRSATDDFSEGMRLKCGGDWTDVYRGRINHATVAVKMLNLVNNGFSQEAFQAKVKLLSSIRHPHIVAIIGFCQEPKCIIFEYMHNGSLRDILFSSHKNSGRKNRVLHWPDRVRIAGQIFSGLGFLSSAKPRPIIHGNLNPSKILLNRNFVAKIQSFGLTQCSNECDLRSDVHAFGVLILQLLTGRNWAGMVEEALVMDSAALIGVLDRMAGEWPLELAREFAGVAMMCLSANQELNEDLRMAAIAQELDKVREMADDLEKQGRCEVVIEGDLDAEDVIDVPSFFFCPIFRDVMKNPHVAADGFSYELEAIEEWLTMGHNTSPMTNLRLKHNHLTPNQTLRSLIRDWHSRRSIPLP